MSKSAEPDFEATLAQIESTIHTLEDEQTSLVDALAAFEQGIKLTRQAQQTLLEAEQKVKLLVESQGEPTLVAFTDEITE
jgi:exodeoxyribonuclease VII small subunit